jgi:hypothetical protein
LGLSVDQIKELLEQFEKESKALKNEVLEMCWHMRGAVSYDDGMMLSYIDREIINKIIKEHIETTQKSGLPFF